MIEKQITYMGNEFDEPMVTMVGDDMEKTASTYAPDILQYLSSLKKRKDMVYALVNALTAGEYYGSNRNGDYFPEEELINHHSTFREHGHVYRHHINKDPKKSYGKVLYSTYNPTMKRVELVISLDLNASGIEKIIKQIQESTGSTALSMGCKVPYDVCSVCGNKAKTRAEYCDHAKNHMGEILSDGRKVYVKNPRPRFFDISFVTIPADPTSSVIKVFNMDRAMSKVASVETKQADDKSAEIKKQIQLNVESVEDDPKKLILATQGELSDEKIKKLAEFPLSQTLSTLAGLRIMPTPEQFQKIALYSMGHEKIADEYERKGIVFQPGRAKDIPGIKPDNFNEKIAEVIGDDVLELSLLKPLVVSRVLNKTAQQVRPENRSYLKRVFFDSPEPEEYKESPVKNPIAPMFVLGSIYAGYSKIFGNKGVTGFTKFIKRNPYMAPLIGLGAAGASTQLQAMLYEDSSIVENEKTAFKVRGPGELFLLNSMVGVPLSYFYSGRAEYKKQTGQPITNVENFVRNNPLSSALLAAGGATGIQRGMLKNLSKAKAKLFKGAEAFCELDTKTQTSLYNSLIN